ncbi:acyltransferase [Actinoplanes sp. NPDC051851]|uniref:acyltransferase family protein n=1 Tax=Actinoplanes sp. NPDC051851 TaxID=3154753 RepID=UPI0034484908
MPTRLKWLDALRGIAVLAVVYEHFASYLAPDLKLVTVQWFHAGTFGVTLFFLVSGYIVPASIERSGSARRFWIGRVFRLYPAFTVAIALAGLVAQAEYGAVPEGLREHPGATLLAHASMLQEALGFPNAQYQFWTLSYEMLFYLVVTVLFVAGAHRFSAGIALVLAVAAVALGGVLPTRTFAGSETAMLTAAVVTTVVLAAGVTAVCTRRRALVAGGAVLLGAGVLALLGCNQRTGPWEGFVILGVMFAGTAIHRAERGQTARWRAVAAVLGVTGAAIAGACAYGGMWTLMGTDTFPAARSWSAGVVLAVLVFGVAMALRHRRVPGPLAVVIRRAWVGPLAVVIRRAWVGPLAVVIRRAWVSPFAVVGPRAWVGPLAWVGTVSYSVYLLHMVVLFAARGWIEFAAGAPVPVRAGVAVVYLAVVLVLGHISHRYVEMPFQRLAGRVAGRRDTPDRGAHKSPEITAKGLDTVLIGQRRSGHLTG